MKTLSTTLLLLSLSFTVSATYETSIDVCANSTNNRSVLLVGLHHFWIGSLNTLLTTFLAAESIRGSWEKRTSLLLRTRPRQICCVGLFVWELNKFQISLTNERRL